MPSKKSVKKARKVLSEKTGSQKCYKPIPELVKEINTFLRGWSNYFDFGYPSMAIRDVNYHAHRRLKIHLNRRSQRKYHRSEGASHYQQLQKLGFERI